MQLKELESHGLIAKTIYAQVPLKVEYRLTDFGFTLIPIISLLGKWGDEHQEYLRKVISISLEQEN